MKPNCFLPFLFIIAWIFVGISLLEGGLCNAQVDYNAGGIRADEYRQRRSALRAKMDPASIAVLNTRNNARRSRNEDYSYRQNSDFLYLTGCIEPNSTLVLIPDGLLVNGKKVQEILFIAPNTKGRMGKSPGAEGTEEIFGFGSEGTQSIALINDRMNEILKPLISSLDVLYYTPSVVETLLEPRSDNYFISLRELIKNLQNKRTDLVIKEISPLIGEMRVVKSLAEIVLIQKAVDATVIAQIEAFKSCEPDMFEYQLQAVVEYCFTQAGAESTGFPSIIGSGPNTQKFHYDTNRRKMQSGELVVMDIGAEYHGYSADISRTIPVNGKFTPAQKEIYELVYYAQQSAIDSIYPGKIMAEIEESAMKVMAGGLVRLGIATDSSDVKKYCPHRISHFIGLDVHDNKSTGRLVPDMVMTVEPGIYIPEGSACDKKYWNIGIRIEDDIIVTDKGRIVLSALAPKSVTDIEMLMKKKDFGNQPVGEE